MSREEREAHFHSVKRANQKPGSVEYQKYTAYTKWYWATYANESFTDKWMKQWCPGNRILDFGCGEGDSSILLAQFGATVVGVDITEDAVQVARDLAIAKGLEDKIEFQVGNVEALDFEDESFDAIWCHGVLHHVDMRIALTEMNRLLKPGGSAIATEALKYNPFISIYRRLTPHLRSSDERPLSKSDIDVAPEIFPRIERRFFHLTSLFVVPLRSIPGSKLLLKATSFIDGILLRIPIFQWLAWQVTLILHKPAK